MLHVSIMEIRIGRKWGVGGVESGREGLKNSYKIYELI